GIDHGLGAFELRDHLRAAEFNRQIRCPFTRLVYRSPLDLLPRTLRLELPLLKQLKCRNLSQIKNIADGGAVRIEFETSIVADAEVPHGLRERRHNRQRTNGPQVPVFHYNVPYEFYSGSGFMRQVVTAQDIPAEGELRVQAGSLITASARETAAARGVRIVEL